MRETRAWAPALTWCSLSGDGGGQRHHLVGVPGMLAVATIPHANGMPVYICTEYRWTWREHVACFGEAGQRDCFFQDGSERAACRWCSGEGGGGKDGGVKVTLTGWLWLARLLSSQHWRQ